MVTEKQALDLCSEARRMGIVIGLGAGLLIGSALAMGLFPEMHANNDSCQAASNKAWCLTR